MTLNTLNKPPLGSWDLSLAACIDHTLLRADAEVKDIEQLCSEAKIWRLAAVCINPSFVALAAQLLQGAGPVVCSVIGFPLGAHTTEIKIFEAAQAIEQGAMELDVVLNIGALKARQIGLVASELAGLRRVAMGITLKLILETCALTPDEIVLACKLASEAGFEFVKTSTGFGSHGATIEHVALMKASIPQLMQVKASGGIKDRSKALELVAAGATRLGSSQSWQLIQFGS